jgi:hypothetical protein
VEFELTSRALGFWLLPEAAGCSRKHWMFLISSANSFFFFNSKLFFLVLILLTCFFYLLLSLDQPIADFFLGGREHSSLYFIYIYVFF